MMKRKKMTNNKGQFTHLARGFQMQGIQRHVEGCRRVSRQTLNYADIVPPAVRWPAVTVFNSVMTVV